MVIRLGGRAGSLIGLRDERLDVVGDPVVRLFDGRDSAAVEEARREW